MRVKIDDRAFQTALKRAPDTIKQGTHSMLERAGIQTQGIMRRRVNVGVSGELRKSIRYTFENFLTISVYPAAKHAAPHEYGTRPHWVSVKRGTPLYQWSRMKGINPYAMQRAIAKKGTRPHPYLKRTLLDVDGSLPAEMSNGISNGMSKPPSIVLLMVASNSPEELS